MSSVFKKIYLYQSMVLRLTFSSVYDVAGFSPMQARIMALRSKDQGWQNVAEFWRGNKHSPAPLGRE
jgi:hypothetical protein